MIIVRYRPHYIHRLSRLNKKPSIIWEPFNILRRHKGDVEWKSLNTSVMVSKILYPSNNIVMVLPFVHTFTFTSLAKTALKIFYFHLKICTTKYVNLCNKKCHYRNNITYLPLYKTYIIHTFYYPNARCNVGIIL